jgi:hypothetical protein
LISQSVGGFTVNVGWGASEACEGGQFLEKNINGVTYVIVEGGFVALGEAAAKEVVAIGVNVAGAERAREEGVWREEW